ncbi:MAG TPA: M56 family metallopeptidase [Vicinamibacterales bacterium]|nr:M56 family metallopeptidase [Vicinamibacterales bacterium]
MSPLTLGNLAAWSIQAALIVGAGLTTLWLVRLEAPAVRYLFLRGLLAICLTLPLVQPRTTVEMALERGTTGGVAIAVAPGQARGPANALAAHALPSPSAIAAVILVGALARLVWIAAGIVKLRRLRRAGAVAEASADHEDLQRVIAARATIRYVRELAQPVTFGFLAPVILLPSAVRDQPASIQRAVLAHELWHVRRRDWLWTLCEEGLRAAVWFHPAVWSLLSRIQSAREEVVDELTVLTTGSRRTYVDALLAFADSSPSMAAPAFARRKHLVRRLVLISKEAVMSGRRVVASGAALGAVVLITSWYSVQAFPMRGAQQLPSDAASAAPGPLERQAKPITPENPIPRRTYNVPAPDPAGLEDAGGGGTVTMRLTLDDSGHVAEVRALRVVYRQKDSLTVDIPEPTRESLDRMAQGSYRGSASDRSIPMQRAAQNVEAMIGSATQAVRQWQYAPPADGPISFNVPVHFGAPPPPPPPPPVPGTRASAPPPPPPPPPPDWARQDASDPPLRVGGTIKPPTKLKNVNPVYPPEAQDAKVQGVVIIEARIERDGTVGRARVLRSIPMLDDAAVDAVRQWEFTPTLLNGAPMPVMMTVTVNFTLQ